MPKIFTHLTLFMFLITALSGVYMRLVPFNQTIAEYPYDHILHAHSHVALLGWAFSSVFIIFLIIFWPELSKRSRQHSMTITTTMVIVALLMFIAFVYEGYAVYSIVLSTLHIFVEYWAALFIYTHIRQNKSFSKIGKLFVKGSLIALMISSIGPYMLGFLSANGLRESYLFDMSVYFYLHFQYNGWLFLSLIGLFLFILEKKGVTLQSHFLRKGFWLSFISIFPGYFLSVLWVDLGGFFTTLAVIGSIGQWIGVLYIFITVINNWDCVISTTTRLTCTSLMITFLLLLVKSTLELGLISPTVAELVYETRGIIIGYLHLTLLGFISIFILTQLQMLNIIDTMKKTVLVGFWSFFIGFGLNESLLFTKGVLSWMNVSTIPLYLEGLLVASILLLIGIAIIWYAIFDHPHKGKNEK